MLSKREVKKLVKRFNKEMKATGIDRVAMLKDIKSGTQDFNSRGRGGLSKNMRVGV